MTSRLPRHLEELDTLSQIELTVFWSDATRSLKRQHGVNARRRWAYPWLSVELTLRRKPATSFPSTARYESQDSAGDGVSQGPGLDPAHQLCHSTLLLDASCSGLHLTAHPKLPDVYGNSAGLSSLPSPALRSSTSMAILDTSGLTADGTSAAEDSGARAATRAAPRTHPCRMRTDHQELKQVNRETTTTVGREHLRVLATCRRATPMSEACVPRVADATYLFQSACGSSPRQSLRLAG